MSHFNVSDFTILYYIYTGMVCVLIIAFHSFSVFVDILDFVYVLFHTYLV